jgi:hypothetical protein
MAPLNLPTADRTAAVMTTSFMRCTPLTRVAHHTRIVAADVNTT